MSLDLARAFVHLGRKVEFALLQNDGELLSAAEREFSISSLDALRVRECFLPLVNYLRKQRPDAVIAMMWPLTAVLPLAAKIARYHGRIAVCEHGTISAQYRGWGASHRLILRASTAIGYRLADARVGVSDGIASDMARISGLDRSAFDTIYNAVKPMTAPGPEQVRAAENVWQTSGPRLLAVGNLKAVKNHSLLMRAFGRLSRSDARLMLVGQGHDEAMLRALAAELGIADRVIFAGFRPDPSPLYATADLFVLSSNNEGLPTALIEALSFGLPVVSTDCPSGPAEILENGRWGRLVPVGDADALARAMEEALSAPVDREALKRRAADFSPEIAARKYLDLLGLA